MTVPVLLCFFFGFLIFTRSLILNGLGDDVVFVTGMAIIGVCCVLATMGLFDRSSDSILLSRSLMLIVLAFDLLVNFLTSFLRCLFSRVSDCNLDSSSTNLSAVFVWL